MQIQLARACTAPDAINGHTVILPKLFFLFQPSYVLKSSLYVNSKGVQYSVRRTFLLQVLNILILQFVCGLSIKTAGIIIIIIIIVYYQQHGGAVWGGCAGTGCSCPSPGAPELGLCPGRRVWLTRSTNHQVQHSQCHMWVSSLRAHKYLIPFTLGSLCNSVHTHSLACSGSQAECAEHPVGWDGHTCAVFGPGACCVCLHILPVWKINPEESKHSCLTFLVPWRGMVTLVFTARKVFLLMSFESVSFEPQHFAVGSHSQQPNDVRSSFRLLRNCYCRPLDFEQEMWKLTREMQSCSFPSKHRIPNTLVHLQDL